MSDPNIKGITLALVGALVIVPDTLLMRWSGLSATQMIAWRGLLLAAVLICFWLTVSRDRWSDLSLLATRAGLGAAGAQAVNAGLFAYGIANAPVATVLFALATVPIVAGAMGALFLGDRMSRATLVASALVFAGIALSVSGGGHGGGGDTGSAVLGAVCGFVVAIALAGSFTIYRARPGLSVSATVGTGALVAGTCGWLLVGDMTPAGANLPAIWVTGLLILPISFTCFNVASRYTVAANVSLVLLLETVLGPVVVWWGTGEAVGPRGLIGGAIVVATLAVYLADQRRRAVRRAVYSAEAPR